MKKLTILALAACTSASFAVELYNNGSMITHPGAGPSGANVSMADLPNNIAGNSAWTGGNFAVADNFTVGGAGWTVNNIVAYGYQSNATTPAWTGVTMNILNGTPGVGSVVATSTSFGIAYTNINRVFNGMANVTNVARRVHSITMDFGALNLGPGSYWFTLQIAGGASAWIPHVMTPDPAGGAAVTTNLGNYMQGSLMNTTPTWAAGNIAPVGSAPYNPDLPFIVNGTAVPEPATMAALGLGAAALIRRRRK